MEKVPESKPIYQSRTRNQADYKIEIPLFEEFIVKIGCKQNSFNKRTVLLDPYPDFLSTNGGFEIERLRNRLDFGINSTRILIY
ncbi:hypothetical protein LEP1GSC058_0327 [Leptospira fainei serovar Hurstbridge str. BUT 6]|uniref:Uncharacterized protein n=1 Tax=Leptospira fainei serovar Hurstbridge str. BUT 6 TaxID=1193011 RepID=S3V097_9LEPT|nr:hypothetical protein LEP1GSC058_0327 [Leptospira fainei serovar Hurstbridge str. BUT 6]